MDDNKIFYLLQEKQKIDNILLNLNEPYELLILKTIDNINESNFININMKLFEQINENEIQKTQLLCATQLVNMMAINLTNPSELSTYILNYNALLKKYENDLSKEMINHLKDFSYIYKLKQLMNPQILDNYINYEDIFTYDFSQIISAEQNKTKKIIYDKIDETYIDDNYGLSLDEIMNCIKIKFDIKDEYIKVIKKIVKMLLTAYVGIYDNENKIKIDKEFKDLMNVNDLFKNLSSDKLIIRQLKLNFNNNDITYIQNFLVNLLTIKSLEKILIILKKIES